jgi:hypothetical protein
MLDIVPSRSDVFDRNSDPAPYFSLKRSVNVKSLREFASSTNGDQWFLGIDDGTSREMVVHRGNPSSGGHETTIPVTSFLNQRPFGPEHGALFSLLADRRAAEGEEIPARPG